MLGDISHLHVYFAVVLVPLLAVLFGARLWSRFLRRQVARRTEDQVSEIDARDQAEERIRHLNSVLRAVRNVNQLITRVKDRDALIANACELLVETRGCDSAWLVLLDDNNKPVRSAQAGLGRVFDELLEQMENGNLNVCSKRAIERAGVAVIDDPQSSCGDCPLLGQQPSFGALTVRLEHEGRVFGLLSVEIPDRLVLDDEEQELVKEIADDIAFALYAVDAREEHEWLDQALRESESRLIAAQHMAGMGDFTWDVETGEVTWSDALFDLLGYDKSDIIDYARVRAEIHHPDDLEGVSAWLHDCIASGQDELIPNEYRIIRKDGEVLFVRTVGVIERDEGKSAKVFATVQDITERKRAEEALQQSEHNLQEAQRLTHIGSWVWNLGTQEVVCSDEMLRIWGYRPERRSLTPEQVMDRIHTEDRDRVRRELEKATEDTVPHEAEFRLVLPDGRERVVHGMGQLERDGVGNPLVLRGTGQDITERKQAEKLLRAREEFLDRVIEQSPFAIWISDADGTLQHANPALKRFLNLTDDQLVGKYNVLHDPVVERQGLIPLIRTVYEEGQSVSFTCDWDGEDIPTLDLKGSSSVSIEATMFPIHNPEGELTNVVLNWIDISERKRAEEELRESEERLELAIAGSNGGVWHMALNPDDPPHPLPDEIYLSPRLKALIGYEDDEFPNSMAAWDSHIIAEDLPRLRERLREHLKGRVDLHDAEYRMRHKDGSIRWIRTRGRVQRDEHGRSIRFAGIDWDITERKRAEEEAAWLAKFPSENPNPVLRVGRDGTLLYANAAAFPLLNCWGCQVGGSLPERWRDLGGQVLKTEAGADAEVEVGDRTLSLTFAPVVDAEYVNIYGLDVTERRQASDALRESEERYRRIFNDSAVALWEMDFSTVREYVEKLKKQGIKDVVGRIDGNAESSSELVSMIGLLDFNDTTLSMFKARSRQELRDSFGYLVTDDSRASFMQCIRDFDNGELVYNNEQRQKRVDGEDVLVDLTAMIAPGSEETWDRVLITLQDITDRKQAEQALGERVKELTCLYAVSRDLQQDLSIDELCQRVVEHLIPSMLYPEITVPLIELNDRRLTTNNYTEHLSHGLHAEIKVQGEARGLLSVYYMEEKTFLIPEEQSLVNGVAEFLGAWLERRGALETLTAYSERLEEMVEERTLELQEASQQLIRQEKLTVLGQLAAGVGHELRNPLGAIKNAAYFLNMAQEDPDAETREMLGVLDEEVDTAERIISSLLDFAITKPPSQRRLCLNDIVRGTLSATWPYTTHIELELQLDDNLPSIMGDPDQLSQVVSNIILNGIQAMPPYSPSPRSGPDQVGRLVVRTVQEGPRWVTLVVADSGEGIPEEHLGKIFEPLFTTKAKGIGLGLALVKTLVEGHRGSVQVESDPGQGTTFTVRLPLGTDSGVKGEGAQHRHGAQDKHLDSRR